MRSGSEFWISGELAEKISNILVQQKSHSFMRLAELGGRVINTADIVEICTAQQIDERNRLKNKEWQCAEKTWHRKGDKCFCAREKANERARIIRRQEMEEANKPLTKEQQKKISNWFDETRKILEDKGILAKKMKI